jgi:O-antigen/teichoic acid export membrane protein
MYFARTVGASVIGAYFLFMAYYSIISMVTDGGIGGAAIKRISEGEEQDEYFSAAFFLRAILTFAILVVIIIFRSHFVDLNNAGIFVWLLIALVLSIIRGPLYNGIAGCGKMGIHSMGSYIGDMSRTFIQVLAIFMGYGLAGLAGGFIAGIIVSAIISLPFLDLRIAHFEWKHIKNLSTFSFWLFLTSSGILIYSYADRIIIGYYLENADVGIYQIAVQFASLASFATIAIRSTLWPKVSRWGKNEQTELIEISLSKAINYSLILAVPVMTGGIFLGDKLLYTLYGSEFSDGYITMILILMSQVTNVFQYLFTMYLGALDFQKDSFKATAVGATGNIVLNIAFIPLIGIDGAALATLITLALNSALSGLYLSKVMKIKIDYSSMRNILVAAGIMGIFVLAYRMLLNTSSILTIMIPVFLGAIVYFILIVKMDQNIKNEIKKIVFHANLPWPHWL